MYRELKEKLLNDYCYKYELHAHSNPASGCSEIPPEKLNEIFSGNNFNGYVLTNHFLKTSDNCNEVCDRFLNDYKKAKETQGNLNVMLGMEIRFTENVNDYLIYGITENDVEKCYYLLDKGIKNFYKEFKKEENLIIQAHPFRDGMELIEPKYLDGIEVYNMHINHNSRIAKASLYASENKMVIGAGSDFHHPYQENFFSMHFKRELKDSFDVARALKNKEYIIKISDGIILP